MAVISRTDATALLARQDINEIVEEAQQTSAALATFRTVRMSAGTTRMPVLSALPTAGFVTDDTETGTSTKPTSKVTWAQKDLVAEEIAVIVPIHENVFDDSAFNIWAEVRPLVAQELGRVLDGAVLFGTNKPTSWPTSLEDGARAAGNVRSAAAAGDLAEDINQTWALVEADGYDVNVNYAARSLRASLRGLRDTQGGPIYLDNIRSDGATPTVYGETLQYVTNGAWLPASGTAPTDTGATLISGDRTKAILGIRQDMTFKILDQATVGGYNLAEKDMLALRVKFRPAFQVAQPANLIAASGYPFAVLSV